MIILYYLIQDVDIDVTAFPKIENSDIVMVKGPDSNKMMKVTYLAIENQAVKCDIDAKRVDMMSLFLRHSITDETHIVFHSTRPSLVLLADKISTVTDQGDVSRRYTLQVITHDDPPQILVKTLSFNFCIST